MAQAAAIAQLQAYQSMKTAILSSPPVPLSPTTPSTWFAAHVPDAPGSPPSDEDDPPVVLGVREGFRIWRVGLVRDVHMQYVDQRPFATAELVCDGEWTSIRATTPREAQLMWKLMVNEDRVLMSWGLSDAWWTKNKKAICVRAKIFGAHGQRHARHDPEEVPKWGCDCGIWGVDTLEQGNMPLGAWDVQTAVGEGYGDTFLIGKIHGKEKVVEATSGFRCQEAEVVELYDHYPVSYDIASRQWIYDLAARYDVPVRPYPLLTTPSG